jgi:hypothetical protein
MAEPGAAADGGRDAGFPGLSLSARPPLLSFSVGNPNWSPIVSDFQVHLPDVMISATDHLLPLALILFFPLGIVDFIVVDRLIRLEYRNWRKEWEKDGRPHGYLFVAPESKSFGGLLVSLRSSRALRTVWIEWLFKTPEWMAKQEGARRLIWFHRCLVFTLWLPFLCLILLAFLQ